MYVTVAIYSLSTLDHQLAGVLTPSRQSVGSASLSHQNIGSATQVNLHTPPIPTCPILRVGILTYLLE